MVDSVGENVPKYEIPRPRKCFRCKGTCYAYKIKKTRRRGVYDCLWACNGGGNTFSTKEWEDTFIIVDRIPQDHNSKGIDYLRV